jgi:hypothetical protein
MKNNEFKFKHKFKVGDRICIDAKYQKGHAVIVEVSGSVVCFRPLGSWTGYNGETFNFNIDSQFYYEYVTLINSTEDMWQEVLNE